MKQPFTVVALFDGCSAGQQALEKLNITDYIYFASEIDKKAIRVTQTRYPRTIQVGDVRHLKGCDFPKHVDLLTAGSPCQDLSMAGKRKGLTTVENIIVDTLEMYLKLKEEGFQFIGQSYLFWETVRLIKEINPRFILVENVQMGSSWARIFSTALGVEPLKINSSRVSAQNRVRNYWTNIPNVKVPEDKGIRLDHIIPGAIAAGKRVRKLNGDNHYSYPMILRKDGKSNCVMTSSSNTGFYIDNTTGEYTPLTVDEMEVLQTMKKGYTNVSGISLTARKHMIGNSWTVDVIVELFKNIPYEELS